MRDGYFWDPEIMKCITMQVPCVFTKDKPNL